MTFNIYTLGCKVNTYESNVMIDKMKNAGYREVSVDECADISIINTCTVTNTAAHKSMKVIHQAIRKNKGAIIVAVGCFIQNEKNNLKNLEGVHIALGNIGKSKIVEYIEEYIEHKTIKHDVRDIMNVPFESMKLNNFNKTRAFVKIQDGCNNFCSYCIIPYTRGNIRSKKREDVLEEVHNLVSVGHREIVLTGIHTGHYGFEFSHYSFAALLKELVQIDGLERLRISSIEITEITDEVLQVLKESYILVDHMHIPLQSGSNTVLKRMNRKYDIDYFKDKISKIREIRPDISITTDVIVGFPGETEEEFLEMVQTIQQIGFTKLHVFPYSVRNGTVAANMENQLDEMTKKERVKILLELSKKLELAYMEKFIGKEVKLIPEIIRDGYLIGHTGNYLSIKLRGSENDLHVTKKVIIEAIEYPYCVATEI